MPRSLKLACKNFVNHFLENWWKKHNSRILQSLQSCIDRIITNKPSMLQNAKTYETGLSGFHKVVVSTIKLSYQKKERHAWSSIGTIKIFQRSILKIPNRIPNTLYNTLYNTEFPI